MLWETDLLSLQGRYIPAQGNAHSRQAKRTKSRQIQESVGLKPNAEWKKDAKAPS